MQHHCHAGDRRGGHHDQFEEAARGGDGRAGDDVADRAHQREPGKEDDEAGGDGHRRFEVQPQLGAQPVERQRRCGRDGAADRVLEEERQSMPVEPPIDAVDRHGTQRADQTGQQARAKGSRRRERQRTPGQGGDPALVRVRRGDDGVEFFAGLRRRHLVGADAADQAVDGRQPTEVDRPGLHGVQRGGCRGSRSAVGGDVDRRADDVDLAALDAVRGDDGRDLVHRGRRGHPGRHQDGADVPRQIENLADALEVLGIEFRARRRGNPRQGARGWLGFPDDAAQHLAATRAPRLARAITGQRHSTSLPGDTFRFPEAQRAWVDGGSLWRS